MALHLGAFGHGACGVCRGIIGARSGFRLGWRTAGGVWLLFFGGLLLVSGDSSVLPGGWPLGYRSMGFKHFPNFL